MTCPFVDGSNVKLKSGGPTMLFSHYIPPERGRLLTYPLPSGCFCKWFDTAGHFHQDWFQPNDLVTA